jgi:hypothetical protein
MKVSEEEAGEAVLFFFFSVFSFFSFFLTLLLCWFFSGLFTPQGVSYACFRVHFDEK